ncbi:MAG: 50S ribosomal protein L10 [Chlamydiia bacterium]|nr:50S ribosomal protein L10 [Chlamydiia bacterium]
MSEVNTLLVNDIKEKIDADAGFAILDYTGLKSNQANDFRRHLNSVGGEVYVVKKRLLQKAAEQKGIALELSELEGHVAIAMSQDNFLDSLKAVFKYGKENEGVVKVLGAKFENENYNKAEAEALSKLPSLDEMRAQILGMLEAPMAQTLGVIEALLSSVISCVDQKSEKTS